MVVKYDADKVDYETLFTGMDAKMKEMGEYTESKQLDTVERILELRNNILK